MFIGAKIKIIYEKGIGIMIDCFNLSFFNFYTKQRLPVPAGYEQPFYLASLLSPDILEW